MKAVQMEPERHRRKGFEKQMSFKVWRKNLKEVTERRWDCNEAMQDEVNQEESEQDEVDGTKKGANSTGKVMHM